MQLSKCKIAVVVSAVVVSVAVGVALTGYSLYDNNRIVIVRQTIVVDGLPAAFDGFRILQLSDLHSRQFGAHQKRLDDVINSLDYDMIAITGDMLQEGDTDLGPLTDLLVGIRNKQNVFYTAGNTGPDDFDEFTGDKTTVGMTLEGLGVHLLDHPAAISRWSARIWVGEFFDPRWAAARADSAARRLRYEHDTDRSMDLERQVAYETALIAEYARIPAGDTLIGVTHYPVNAAAARDVGAPGPPYRLILAGHYHGGQIRVPFYGALYVPAGSRRESILPAQDLVSGLTKWGNTYQYVSRGLGATAHIPLLAFRLFNPPEINLITLRTSQP